MLTYVATNYESDANQSYPLDPHEKWGYSPDDHMVRSWMEAIICVPDHVNQIAFPSV
jgi:hypothetical protein